MPVPFDKVPYLHATAISALDIFASCTISAAHNIAHLIDITGIPESHKEHVIRKIVVTFENTLRDSCNE